MNKGLFSRGTLALCTGVLFMPLSAQWVHRADQGRLSDGNLTELNGVMLLSHTHDGIFRSLDQGFTWLSSSADITAYVHAVGHDSTFFFAGAEDGIFRSGDGGLTWQPANGTLTFAQGIFPRRFYLHNGRLFVIVKGSINEGGGLYYTMDHGVTWTESPVPISPYYKVNDIASKNGHLYVVSSFHVLKSVDNGLSWTVQLAGTPGSTVGAVGNNLMMARLNGLAYSPDEGVTWIDAVGGVTTDIDMENNIVVYNGYAYATSFYQVFRSIDQGLSWSLFTGGIAGGTGGRGHLFISGQDLFLLADHDLYVTSLAASMDEPEITTYYDLMGGALRIASKTDLNGATLSVCDASGRVLHEQGLSGTNPVVHLDLPRGVSIARITTASGQVHIDRSLLRVY